MPDRIIHILNILRWTLLYYTIFYFVFMFPLLLFLRSFLVDDDEDETLFEKVKLHVICFLIGLFVASILSITTFG